MIKFEFDSVAGAIVTGVACVAGTGFLIWAAVKAAKETKKLQEEFKAYKASNYDREETDKMVNDASVDNDIFDDPDDRVHAKVLLDSMHSAIRNANTINTLDVARDNFLKMYNEFMFGDKESCSANVRYYWTKRVEAQEAAIRAELTARDERMRREELYYEQRKYDTIANALTSSVQAIAASKT